MGMSTGSKFFQWGPRDAAVLPLILTLEGAMSMDRAVGVSWPSTWVLFQPETGNRRGRLKGTWLNDRGALADVGRHCFSYIIEHGSQAFFSDVERASKSLNAEFERLDDPSTMQALSDLELEQAYARFHEAYVAWWRPNYVIEPLEFHAEARSEELFGDKGSLAKVAAKPRQTMEECVTSAMDSLLVRCLDQPDLRTAILKRDLRRVCYELRTSSDLKTIVEDFQREFSWVRNNYYRSGRLTFDEVCAYVVDHCHDVRTRTTQHVEDPLEARLRISTREMMQANSPSAEGAMELLQLWDQMAQFKDDRKKTNLMANQCLEYLLREVCRRRFLPLSDARNLLPDEVSDIIRGEAVPSLLDRRKGLVIVWRNGEPSLHCLYDPDLSALAFGGIGERIAKAAAKIEGGKRISGTGNGYGIVEGIAYVCESYEESLRIPAGSDAILITYMTSPEWLSVISRVRGIVTVEGGQASHAYLSCSQMKKPLLIDAQGAVERGALDRSLDGCVVRLDSNGNTLEVLQTTRGRAQ